ncbi:hypothetical protein ZIOFF_007332 [Zingiber officinale]|uniref:Protein NEGATIVE REGULATOR OF RESISTANCE n=1 Tax=Zingiber officinale TaxID=94328 RepID=A0A8J5IED4_ZINOF|nr:hypothetical protein ZIOFF_007332 [Zingiber officinale]
MDASSSQRKRRGDGDDRLPSKPRPACSSLSRGEKGSTALEEDVEEFFAILRRMRDTSQSVSVGRGTAASARWSPSFEWEDFFGGGAEKVACEGGDGARAVMSAVDEEAKRPQGIDLNADPGLEAEGVVVPSPLGEYPRMLTTTFRMGLASGWVSSACTASPFAGWPTTGSPKAAGAIA